MTFDSVYLWINITSEKWLQTGTKLRFFRRDPWNQNICKTAFVFHLSWIWSFSVFTWPEINVFPSSHNQRKAMKKVYFPVAKITGKSLVFGIRDWKCDYGAALSKPSRVEEFIDFSSSSRTKNWCSFCVTSHSRCQLWWITIGFVESGARRKHH